MNTSTERRPSAITWDEAVDLFEAHLRAKRAGERTRDGYLREIVLFREYVGEGGPAVVTLEELREYQCGLQTGENTRRGKPLAAGTTARIATVLSVFFAFLVEEKVIENDPAARLERPRVPKRLPGDVLSVAQMKKLLMQPSKFTPQGLRDRAILDLMYATGLRLSEVIGLDLSDIEHGERNVIVRNGKGEKGRVVPINRSAYASLSAYIERGRPALASKHEDSLVAFFLSRLGRRICDVSLADVLRKASREAGFAKTAKPHQLRRTFATHLLKNGVNIREIQTLLGHESLETTATYLRIDSKDLRRVLLLKHPRERFDL